MTKQKVLSAAERAQVLAHRAALDKAFNELYAATVAYGLNHTGTKVHTQMEKTLQTMRDQFAKLNAQLDVAQKKAA